jgi:hypothetical protein
MNELAWPLLPNAAGSCALDMVRGSYLLMMNNFW